ncbi:inositol hexakisphosphate kinase 3 [Stylonychia lemnae]|uniref:Kinase n=1 Tax=Stylonychia lemnae TaxID=5949 RepID=A0A078AUR0_STYLE|nr:inositol hexakisphosphate kinase 3 [Stylonychia lemnae]|eukprot:CDW85914.1 inositol hexakisphosphate kinase 3 [Stylonychia lemnae]
MESEQIQCQHQDTQQLHSTQLNKQLSIPIAQGVIYEDQNFISLQIFFKQISGHKYMFLDNDKNVCKMSNQQEIEFFSLKCPQALQAFVPQYKGNFFLRQGVDKLDLEEEFDISRYCPTTSVLSKSSSSSSIDSSFSIKDLQQLLEDESQNNIAQEILHKFLNPISSTPLNEYTADNLISSQILNKPVPNSDSIHSKELQIHLGTEQNQLTLSNSGQVEEQKKWKKNQITPEEYKMKIEKTLDELVSKQAWLGRLLKKTHKINFYDKPFICLENLTSPYKHPCMMDLKIGSVAYNPKKSQKQQLKILNSTSGCFSFRISGMEVYKTIDKRIIFRNKYWGRSIKRDEIHDSLGMFFYNGCCIRLNVVEEFIQRIKELKKVVLECKGFKFHSSSLLLVYDGYLADRYFQTNCENPEHQRFVNTFKKSTSSKQANIDSTTSSRTSYVDLRIIDFANFEYLPGIEAPDEDMIKGLDNLVGIFQKLLESPQIVLKS